MKHLLIALTGIPRQVNLMTNKNILQKYISMEKDKILGFLANGE